MIGQHWMELGTEAEGAGHRRRKCFDWRELINYAGIAPLSDYYAGVVGTGVGWEFPLFGWEGAHSNYQMSDAYFYLYYYHCGIISGSHQIY